MMLNRFLTRICSDVGRGTSRFPRGGLLPVMLIAVSCVALASCASVQTAVDGAKGVGQKGLQAGQRGLSKLGLDSNNGGSGSAGASSAQASSAPDQSPVSEPVVRDAGANQMMSEFALDEVPHTLDRKPVAEGRLTSTYGYRMRPTGLKFLPKKHNGIDYAAPQGTPIYASGDGVIEKLYVSSSFGNIIRIKHANGFHSAYAHMAAFFDGLSVGDTVSKGQQIGTVGTTGRSTGAHLHYELTYNGKHIDPLF